MNLSLLGNLRKALLALTVACFVAGVAIAPACDRAALENYRHDPTDRFVEMQWPDRGLGAMLPAPESSYGVIYNDKAQWFNGDVGNYTREQYGAYVASCEDAGFTVEYTKNNDAFWAWNEEGYYLHLGYDEDKSYMSFSLEAPKEEESGGPGVSNGGSEEDVGADDGAATDAPTKRLIKTKSLRAVLLLRVRSPLRSKNIWTAMRRSSMSTSLSWTNTKSQPTTLPKCWMISIPTWSGTRT